ncbi:MAG: ABC transporter substrate-binding protein [Polyangiales bacterium]
MRVVTLRDPNTLALRLLHGRGDLAELKPDVLSLFEGDTRIAIRAAPTSGVTYVGLHCAHGPLADPRVRRALAHAIDRDGLRRARVGRYGVTATGVLPPAHWAYTAEVARYAYDPDRARELLDEAGLRASGGAPRARFTLRVSSQRAAILSAQAIAAMLREVGVEVDVRPSELATLLSDLRAGRFDLTLLTIPDLSDPWGLGFWFGTASIPTARNPGAGGNRWRFSDARLDAALERGLREHEPSRRAPHYRDAQRVLAEQLPVIPLWHADVVWALRRPWTGLAPRGDGMLDFVTAIRRVAP